MKLLFLFLLFTFIALSYEAVAAEDKPDLKIMDEFIGKKFDEFYRNYLDGLPYDTFSVTGNSPKAGFILIFKIQQVKNFSEKKFEADFVTFFIDGEYNLAGYSLGGRRLLMDGDLNF